MKYRVLIAAFIIVLVSISGCASVAPQRVEYINIPPLEKGWSRVFIAAGQLEDTFNVDLKNTSNTGPVYINDQKIGSTAYKEHIAVDLLPGSYQVNWMPEVSDKFYSEKKAITLKSGEVRYFTGDMEVYGAGARIGLGFGLIGNALTEYVYRGKINEKPSLDSKSKLVSYLKLNGSSIVNLPATHDSVANRFNADVAPVNIPTNESVSQKLRELQSLRKDGVITEDDFQKKKQQLLEKL